MPSTTTPSDSLRWLLDLTAEDLRHRLTELDAEARAVRAVLRVILARERQARRQSRPPSAAEVTHA
jgi:hypothetical protein